MTKAINSHSKICFRSNFFLLRAKEKSKQIHTEWGVGCCLIQLIEGESSVTKKQASDGYVFHKKNILETHQKSGLISIVVVPVPNLKKFL